MSESNIKGLMDSTMGNLRGMVDADTIIGSPLVVGDVTLFPVSKVAFGLASGGSDFPSKTTQSGLFGGGGGAGVTISPVGFIVIKDGDVSVKYISEGAENSAERIISMVPDMVNKVSDVVSKFKADKTEEAVDSVFEEI